MHHLVSKLTSNSRQIAAAHAEYMTEYGKMPDIVFGSIYPTRELCKTMDGVGVGYCGPEWHCPGTPAWKSIGERRTTVLPFTF